MKFDVLFLHAGGFNPEGLQGPFFPIGVIGLASLLEKKGFKSIIVNLLLEKILDPGLDYKAVIKKYCAPIIGIDLHWFVHSYEAIELARLCKEESPSSKIILGGLTASQFDKEILNRFSFIDVIFRGDSEFPLVQYVSYVKNTEKISLQDIPNITYRDPKGEIKQSQGKFNISRELLDELDFLRFDLVHNWEKCLSLVNTDYIPFTETNRTSDLREYYNESLPVKAWILYTGRGCNYKCSFCGGSSTAFRRAFDRTLILRSPGRIADDVLKYNETNVDIIYIPHSPLITDSRFHHQVLDNIISKLESTPDSKFKLGFIFEDCPFIVDFEILGRYLKVFDREKSIFRLYLADIEQEAAAFNNFPVDIDKTNSLIDYLIGRAHILIGIVIGLPGQTYKSTLKMAEFARRTRGKKAIVMVYKAELHPGSELILHPANYRVDLELKNFSNYYDFLKSKKDKSMIYGYKTNNDISIEEQKKILEDAIGPLEI